MKNKTVGIGGSGVMGSSMAQIFAKYGYDVILFDVSGDAIEKSRKLIGLNQQALVEEKELTLDRSEALKNRITFCCDMKSLSAAGFVIEAIVEKMPEKHAFFRELSEILSTDAVIVSNTSGLPLNEIAKSVKNPGRFAGMHWINPPHIIPLVEVIRTETTTDETVKAVFDLALAIGKKPVMVKTDAPGFIFNRIQFAVLREAMHIVESGIADIEDVDNVLKSGMGMRYSVLGPFEIADFGGLDTFFHISRYLFSDLSDAKEPQSGLEELYNKGDFGVKTGKGFYDYSGGKDEEAILRRDARLFKLSKFFEVF